MRQTLRRDAHAASALPVLEGTVLGTFRLSDLFVALYSAVLGVLQVCTIAEAIDTAWLLIRFLREYTLTSV